MHYGIDSPTRCQIDALAPTGVPASYTGLIDSHRRRPGTGAAADAATSAAGLGRPGQRVPVSPRHHDLRRLATGFAGATNLAVTPGGRILVAELFAGRISTIEHGRPSLVIDLPKVASVEFYRHAVYAGTTGDMTEAGFSGHGSVVKIDTRW